VQCKSPCPLRANSGQDRLICMSACCGQLAKDDRSQYESTMNFPRLEPASACVSLRRSLTLWPLLFYGLAVIVGAGIYVAIASVIDRAGEAAPLSFLLAGISRWINREIGMSVGKCTR
jgi:hypothetical protein